MKPRILVVENSIAVTGAFKAILRNCVAIRDRFDFYFVFPKGSSCLLAAEENGFQTFELPMKELSRRPLSWIAYIPFLLRNTLRLHGILKRHKIDLIHVNDFYNLIPSCYSATGGRVPYICHVRFMPSRFPPPLLKIIFGTHERYAQKIIAVSRAVVSELPTNDKIILLYDSMPEIGSLFHYDAGSRTILYLSNYIKGKGQDYALSAFSKIAERYPDWKLKFVGGDLGLRKNTEFRQSLQQMAVTLKIDDRVEWGNFVSDVSSEYRHAGLILNFSDSESFSMTCLEALHCGRPVIATRSGGTSEIIDDGLSGLLVPVGSIDEMQSALVRLLDNADLRSKMGAHGYDSVRQKFDFRQLADRLASVYLPLVHRYSSN